MKKVLVFILKLVISLLAVGNILWFLVFDYKNPKEVLHNQHNTDSTEAIVSLTNAKLVVPQNSLKYNGNGKFEPLKGVYVVDEKGILIDSAKITYEIKQGTTDNIREKVIEYEATVNDETLYSKRNLSLGIDYTGPSIFVKKALPYCKEGEINTYVEKLKDTSLLEVLDGFGNSIIDDITVELKRYDKGEELATVTISVTNQYKDNFNIDYQIPMNESGIVLTLVNDKAVLTYGSSFKVSDYVDLCYFEDESNSLMSNLTYDGNVNTSEPGKYSIKVYTSHDGERSIGRELSVSVLEQESGDENENS